MSAYGKDEFIRFFDKTLNDKEVLYPVGKTKKEVITEAQGLQLPNRLSRSLNQIVEDGDNNVNREKDLLAIHNLNESKLKKSLELGGLAMPSIAITND